MKRLFDTVTVVDACGLSVVGLRLDAQKGEGRHRSDGLLPSVRARGTENVTFRYQVGKRDGC